MNIIKTTFIATTLIALSAGHASAAPSDAICVITGKIAAAIANVRDEGSSEERTISVISSVYDPKGHSRDEKLVAYVYTMGYSAADSRKMAYLKCKAGDFD